MLSFDSSLSDSLSLGNTTVFWVLKLYYDDETDFIGVSETDRYDGTDRYYGLVSSWGNYQQSLDFFNFTTSTGNMTVKLINTERSYQGGRFSDLTNNFANRKWELFVNTIGLSTYDTSTRMIASGMISGDYQYDEKSITLTLLDYSSKYHKRIPQAVIQNTESGDDYYYINAPEKNIGKPIPMAYGDFHDDGGTGTAPSDTFDQHYNHNPFPAIITDNWNQSGEYVFALSDKAAIHTLDTDNIYMFNKEYLNCSPSNVDIASNPTVKFRGSDWYYYTLLSPESGTENGSDGDFGTEYAFTVPAGSPWNITKHYGIPKISKLGVVNQVRILIYWKFTGDIPITAGPGGGGFHGYLTPQDGSAYVFEDSWNPVGDANFGVTKYTIPLDGTGNSYTETEKDECDLEGDIYFTINDITAQNGTSTITIQEIGLEVKFAPDQTFAKSIQEQYHVSQQEARTMVSPYHYNSNITNEYFIKTRTVTANTPIVADYLYYSGKGRKYDAWVDADSRNQGYNQNDLIENPVFMVEDMLRTELSLTSSEIDYDTFDDSGNSTNGYIGDIYGDAVGDVKFAFSQYKFIDSKDFIEKMCDQIFSWVFIDGTGKFKIKTLKSSYSDSDMVVDYGDITFKGISKTSLNTVRNDITIKYNYDYGQDQPLSQINTTDATSQGDTSSGYNQELKLILEASGIVDETTATKLADAYLELFKDRKNLIEFDVKRPKYLELEIGDIIEFSNWDSKIKLYGSAMSGYWMVTDISKKPQSCSIKGIQL